MTMTSDASRAARDFVFGIAETTADDLRALRAAGRIQLGRERVGRAQILLGDAVSRAQLARRPITDGEPFRL